MFLVSLTNCIITYDSGLSFCGSGEHVTWVFVNGVVFLDTVGGVWSGRMCVVVVAVHSKKKTANELATAKFLPCMSRGRLLFYLWT